MKRKKLASLILTVVLGSSMMLTGCGSSDGGNDAPADKSQAEEKDTNEGAGDAQDSGEEAGGAEDENADIPKYDPDKTYDLSFTGAWCPSTYPHDNFIETMLEEKLNLNITVEVTDTSDSLNLMLASGEMPDCMWNFGDISPTFMEENELTRTIPRKMVEYYCPTLISYYDEYPLMYEMLTDENGDFRYLTGVTFQFVDYYLPGDFYRYDWIEELGIDLGVNVKQVSEKVYIAEEGIEWSKFQEIMEAFSTLGDDIYPMTSAALAQGQFFSGFGFHSGINDVNGRAEQYYVMDEYKEFLKGFADLYAKGYIDPDIIAGNRQLGWDKVNAGVCGYWITSTSALQTWAADRPPLTLMERVPEAKILATPGLRPDGGEAQAIANATPAYGYFYVNKNVDDEFLAKILEFNEYILFAGGDKDIHCSMFYGEKGVDWEWNEDETMPVILNDLLSGEKGTWSFSQFGQDRLVAQWAYEEPLFMDGAEFWCKDGSWMKWQGIEYKSDISNTTDYATISTEVSGDIGAKVGEFRSQALLGQIDIDAEWDNYIETLEGYGYTRLMDELEKVEPLQDIINSYN